MLDLALLPSTTYSYRLKACKAELCGEPALPDPVQTRGSSLPTTELTVSEPGFTDDILVMGVAGLADNYAGIGHMMALDRTGRIIWEYENNKEGLITEVHALPGGRLGAEQLISLVDIDLDGTVVKKFTELPAHHALQVLSDGRYAALTFDRIQQSGKGVLLGDGVAIISADWSAVDWQWLTRDHIDMGDVCPLCINDDPYHLGKDWTHANGLTVMMDEAEQKLKLYVNIRNLNRIYRIDYPSGNIDWVMGDGGDFGAGLWSHSHCPEFLPGNRVLLLDNGLHRAGGEEFSRVIEVAYDPAQKKADIVWEYRETPDFYSFALGAVHRQDNGNTFIADGYSGRLLEVTPDKKKVWELKLQQNYGTYKAIVVPKDFFSSW